MAILSMDDGAPEDYLTVSGCELLSLVGLLYNSVKIVVAL